MYNLFTVCTEQMMSPYTEHAASGLPNPTHLEGKVRFAQAQDQQVITTRSQMYTLHAGPVYTSTCSSLFHTQTQQVAFNCSGADMHTQEALFTHAHGACPVLCINMQHASFTSAGTILA